MMTKNLFFREFDLKVLEYVLMGNIGFYTPTPGSQVRFHLFPYLSSTDHSLFIAMGIFPLSADWMQKGIIDKGYGLDWVRYEYWR